MTPGTWKSLLKPLYFSPATEPLRRRCGRLVSGLVFGQPEQETLSEILARIPGETGRCLRDHEGWILETARNGSGMSPLSQWKLLRWLGEKVSDRRIRRASVAKVGDRRLRLLFVTAIFPSVRHGGGIRVFDLIRALGARHEVRLYSVYRSETERASWEALASRLGPSRLIHGEVFSPGDFTAWFQAKGLEPFDAAHLVWPAVEPIMDEIRAASRRVVFEMSECVTRRASMDLARCVIDKNVQGAGRALFGLVEAFRQETSILSKVDGVGAMTAADGDFAHGAFGGVIPTVLPTGVSDHEIREPARALSDPGRGLDVEPTACFVGFYGHPPNVEGMAWYLKNVHPEVRRRVPGFRVRVAGIGDTSVLKAIAAGDDSVEFVGEVKELVPALRRNRICIAPLVSGAGIRLKITQYAAAGRPCVSTGIGVCGTPYVDGKSVLVADEPRAFASAMVKLLTDDVLHARIREGAERIVEEKLSWETLLPEYEAFYGG